MYECKNIYLECTWGREIEERQGSVGRRDVQDERAAERPTLSSEDLVIGE